MIKGWHIASLFLCPNAIAGSNGEALVSPSLTGEQSLSLRLRQPKFKLKERRPVLLLFYKII